MEHEFLLQQFSRMEWVLIIGTIQLISRQPLTGTHSGSLEKSLPSTPLRRCPDQTIVASEFVQQTVECVQHFLLVEQLPRPFVSNHEGNFVSENYETPIIISILSMCWQDPLKNHWEFRMKPQSSSPYSPWPGQTSPQQQVERSSSHSQGTLGIVLGIAFIIGGAKYAHLSSHFNWSCLMMESFTGKLKPETMVFTIKLDGVSGFNFPISQFYDQKFHHVIVHHGGFLKWRIPVSHHGLLNTNHGSDLEKTAMSGIFCWEWFTQF